LLIAFIPVASLAAFTVERVDIPMRDGVRLAADLYLPDGHHRHPVIVTRSPYNRKGERKRGEFFAAHGYAFVAQDVRGRYDSGGAFEPFVNEGPDGYDTIEWAARQRWSNGKVGTTGASYLGMDQFSAAIERPPHLASMWIAVAGTNFYRDSAYAGGTPSYHWPIWILDSASRDPHLSAAQRALVTSILAKPDAWLALPPAQRMATFNQLPHQRDLYRGFHDHPLFDEFWQRPGLDDERSLDKIKDVPIYFVGAWYDSFIGSMMRSFERLRASQKSEKRLQVGPWPHGYGKPICGDAQFGPVAALDEHNAQLDWFNHTLRHKRLRVIESPPVRYFRMGGGAGRQPSGFFPGGSWLTTDSWPPSGAAVRQLYLGPKSTLASRAPLSSSTEAYSYDPANPFKPAGGRTAACIVDQKYSRDDVLTYQTEPLKEAIDATGAVRVHLFITTDGPDTDFTARLIDVYPGGYAMPVADGRIRASYRNSSRKPEATRPGEIYELVVDLGQTSNLFAPGHRVRLDISSSIFPRAEPNPNTGERPWNSGRIRVARNAVWRGGNWASNLELTVIPR